MSYDYGKALSSTSEYTGRDSVDLLARVIYGEAEGESEEGKRGVAFVVANRKAKNSSEFGGNTYEKVILYKVNGTYSFNAMETTRCLKPNTSSQAWQDCLRIASNMVTNVNPIGSCLWFNGKSYYNSVIKITNGIEQYTFGSGYRDITEKYTIGNHIFFKVTGY